MSTETPETNDIDARQKTVSRALIRVFQEQQPWIKALDLPRDAEIIALLTATAVLIAARIVDDGLSHNDIARLVRSIKEILHDRTLFYIGMTQGRKSMHTVAGDTEADSVPG
jgi:hypothetical protein